MAKCRNAEDANKEFLDALSQVMTDKNIDINVGAWQSKMDITNEYVLLFYINLEYIIREYKLSRNDILVILRMLHYMQYGNLLRISFTKLAKDIGIDPKNIHKTINKLKNSKLLIEFEENLYLNPHIVAKGKFKSKDEEATKLLEFSSKELDDNITPSILTKKMRRNRLITECEKWDLKYQCQ